MCIADKTSGTTSSYKIEKQDLYQFMNDKKDIFTSRDQMTTPMSLMGNEKREHDIKSFLGRPQKIGTFSFPSSGVAGSNLLTLHLNDLLTDYATYKCKIEGFRYFKSMTEITLIVNAQPFIAGALLMYYIPYDSASKHWSQKLSFSGKTGFMSEVLNLEDDSPIKMQIPFNHPHGYLDLVKPVGDMGTVFVDIYSGLLASAAASVECTLYARFLNVELLGPTDEALATSTKLRSESGISNTFSNFKYTLIQFLRCRLWTPWVKVECGSYDDDWSDSEEEDDYIYRMGGEAGESEEMVHEGVVTKTSRIVHSIANQLIGIPIISDIAAPISWISNIINKVASAFGWSKPINVTTTDVTKLCPARYMNNFNGIDTSNNLGLDADNMVKEYQFFGDADQLCFDSLITRLNYVSFFGWTANHATDYTVYSTNVSPYSGVDIAPVGTNEVYTRVMDLSFLGFVSSFFRYWRGDIRYQFRCIKTKFHSGRLLITWRPGVTPGDFNVAKPQTYSIIWDVAKSNTISFVIPYMNPRPWLFNKMIRSDDLATADSVNGVLVVSVLNKLVSATTVHASVSIMVEIAGEKGFHFGHPQESHLIPLTTDDPISMQLIPEKKTRLRSEIGIPVNTVIMVPEGTKTFLTEPEALSMGEKIVSFRQLIKRFSPLPVIGDVYDDTLNTKFEKIRNAKIFSVASVKTEDGFDIARFNHAQFDYPPPQYTHQKNVETYMENQPRSVDTLGLVSSIFAYWRGSIRMKIATIGDLRDANVQTFGTMNLINFGTEQDGVIDINRDIPKGLQSALYQNNSSTFYTSSLEGIAEVQIPFYSPTAYQGTRFDPTHENDMYFQLSAYNRRADQKTVFIPYRAAGDDFDFIFPVGVPTFMVKPFNHVDSKQAWPEDG